MQLIRLPTVTARHPCRYSASDLTALCKEAAMLPLRELGPAISSVPADRVRPLQLSDFDAALKVIRPSMNPKMAARYEEFTQEYGTTGV